MSDAPHDALAAQATGAFRQSAADLAVFLDVDGTLLGFRSQPGEVVADPDLLTLLGSLSGATSGALALVSGRMIADLDRIVAPLKLPAAGVHGADIRFADGRRAAMGATAMDPVRAAVEAFVATRPGLLLEDKGATLALHYRHAPEREAEIRDFLRDLRERSGTAVQEGKLVAELKPSGCDKGTAIMSLMKSAPFQGRRPLFIGDDLTDEHGFAAVNSVDGLSIKVGTAGVDTVATHRVDDPAAVRKFLAGLC